MTSPTDKPAKRKRRPPPRRMSKPADEVRRHALRVLVNEKEKAALQGMARQAKRSVGRYLREVGQGYKMDSRLDLDAVRELAKVNGDLGRLGGLLKLWLVKDARTANFSEATIERLLERIEAQQQELGRLMSAIVRPRADSPPSPPGLGVKPLNT